MNHKTLGLALAFSVLSFAALAQSTTTPATSTEVREKMRAACADDVKKFCANIGTEKGAMRTCLDTNTAQLSDSCKAARADRAAAKAAAKPKT
jgi:hypothetical protein